MSSFGRLAFFYRESSGLFVFPHWISPWITFLGSGGLLLCLEEEDVIGSLSGGWFRSWLVVKTWRDTLVLLAACFGNPSGPDYEVVLLLWPRVVLDFYYAVFNVAFNYALSQVSLAGTRCLRCCSNVKSYPQSLAKHDVIRSLEDLAMLLIELVAYVPCNVTVFTRVQ